MRMSSSSATMSIPHALATHTAGTATKEVPNGK